jgi:glycosyltransferase involved in cell wall biosynthesis
MKVSVVIPVYNEEEYLDACLSSVCRQEEPADEIIVVDNNSTDQSMAIAQKYPLRIVKEKKQGISYARNAGFNTAKHEIIARVDADVTLPRNWTKQLKTNFLNNETDAVAGTVDLPTALGKLGTNLILDIFRLTQSGQGTLFGLNMAITKEMWQKVRPYLIMDNKLVHEDMDLALWVWKVGGRVVYDKELVVKSSSRRIFGNPGSFFWEYPRRAIRTIRLKRTFPKK